MVSRILPYLELTHMYAAVAVFVATAGFSVIAVGSMPDVLLLVRLVGVVSLGQACVGITNELRDLPRDRLVKLDRPLVNGRANPAIARAIAMICAGGSFVLGSTFGWVGMLFSLVGIGSGLLYNYWLKGTVWSWLPYAIGFSLLPVWPFVALDAWNPRLAWIGLLIIPASLALNISQSLSDIEEDHSIAYGGITMFLGRTWALIVLWVCCALTISLALITAPLTLLLGVSTAIGSILVLIALWWCYARPGVVAWNMAWYLVAATVGVVGIGWFHAVL